MQQKRVVSQAQFDSLAETYSKRFRVPLDRVKKCGIVLTAETEINGLTFEPGHYEDPRKTLN